MVLVQGISIIVISFVILGLGMYIHNFANKKLREGMTGKKNDWTISSGGTLNQNEYLVSENKQYFFIMQGEGNAVVIVAADQVIIKGLYGPQEQWTGWRYLKFQKITI